MAAAAIVTAFQAAFDSIEATTGLNTTSSGGASLVLTANTQGQFYPAAIGITSTDSTLTGGTIGGVATTANGAFVQATIAGLGDDTLDFSAYGAKWLGAAMLNPQGQVTGNSWSTDGSAGMALPASGVLAAGDKYITLTRANDATTLYKIDLWTVVGDGANPADAYAATSNDSVQLIGYVDLGKVLEGITSTNDEVLDQINI
jgi:hypothetical protein